METGSYYLIFENNLKRNYIYTKDALLRTIIKILKKKQKYTKQTCERNSRRDG